MSFHRRFGLPSQRHSRRESPPPAMVAALFAAIAAVLAALAWLVFQP